MAYQKGGLRYPSTVDSIVAWVMAIPSEEAARLARDEFKQRLETRWPEESKDSTAYPQKFATLRLQGTVRELERFIPRAEAAGAPPTVVKMLRVCAQLAQRAYEIAPTLDGRPRPSADPEPADWAKAIKDDEQRAAEAASAETPVPVAAYDDLLV